MSARRPRALAAAAVALGAGALVASAAPAPAAPAGTFVPGLLESPAGPAILLQRDLALTGRVVVTFRSDPATCAPVGRCGLEGVVVSVPTPEARLLLTSVAPLLESAGLVPGDTGSGSVASRVSRDGRVCADARTTEDAIEVARSGDTLGLGPALAPGGLSTRCAGPSAEDVAAALPVQRVTLAALRARRPLSVDLTATAPFTAGGMTGTVSATVRGRLAAPARARGATFGFDLRADPRLRAVRYDVETTGGALRTLAVAPPEPGRCRALDACGLRVVTELSARPGRSALELFAAPGGSPRGLGLREVLRRAARSGEPGGTRGIGGGGELPPATLAVTARPGDGGPECRDARAVAPPLLSVTGAPGGRVRLALEAAEPGAGSLRSRCPGPALPAQVPLATADLPATALAQRRLTVTLRSRVRTRADGFALAGEGALTLTLVRRRGPAPGAHRETRTVR